MLSCSKTFCNSLCNEKVCFHRNCWGETEFCLVIFKAQKLQSQKTVLSPTKRHQKHYMFYWAITTTHQSVTCSDAFVLLSFSNCVTKHENARERFYVTTFAVISRNLKAENFSPLGDSTLGNISRKKELKESSKHWINLITLFSFLSISVCDEWIINDDNSARG
jgi:hypothetical protein